MARWWSSSTGEHWDGSQIPSQHGKVAVVTGANSGIGFEVAKRLAERGAHVVLACRSEARGREAELLITQHLEELKLAGDKDTGAVEFMEVDMGELASISRFAKRFQERFERLDLLINNAGVSMPAQTHTRDGLESQFGVNHIGAFHLTHLLFEQIKTAPAPRIVAVSSIAHRSAKMDFRTIASGENTRAWAAYESSKMANLLFTYELDRRLRKHASLRHVRAVAAHPGLTHTQLFPKFIIESVPRVLQWLCLRVLSSLPFNTVAIGVLPILYVATVESVASGDYYGPDRWSGYVGYPVREMSTPASYSEDDATQLWALSEEIVEGRFDVQ